MPSETVPMEHSLTACSSTAFHNLCLTGILYPGSIKTGKSSSAMYISMWNRLLSQEADKQAEEENIPEKETGFAGPPPVISIDDDSEYVITETEDEDAGEFEYLFLLPDTPATTFHIEFRYGSDPEAMMLYNDGPYAYWLAAGIPADRDEQMVEDVIDLFCAENLAEMNMEDAA